MFGNKYSPCVIGIAITSKLKSNLPTHIEIDGTKFGLEKESVILAEQIRTLDKSRLIKKVGILDKVTMEKLKKAMEISFGLRGKIDWRKNLKTYIKLNNLIWYIIHNIV